jgi:hypothetical protein
VLAAAGADSIFVFSLSLLNVLTYLSLFNFCVVIFFFLIDG